ncbi:MAG TPA: hypothetical protein VLA19_24000 [Herpetosiphonaceae bacterium]|nr:hypothetical protein [Herpetosiphonaceae bacterium]
MANLRYAPEFRVTLNGAPIPAALRASISSVSYQNGLEGADRVELALVNENLRWLDHPLLALDNRLSLELGYAPDPLEQVFVGEIVGQSATFPGGGAPMLTVVAHDYRQRLQQGTRERWFAIPAGCLGVLPMPDPTVATLVSYEHLLIPIIDPVSAALSVLIGAAETAVFRGDPDSLQKVIRKQVGETNYDFLRRIAHENGWEMLVDHGGPLGGRQLRFLSLAEHCSSDLTLKYGQSLIDFTPRLSKVGQIAGVSARIWQPHSKTDFTITVSWDWDRSSLNLSITPEIAFPGSAKEREGSILLVEEPVTQLSAPRVILSKLFARLNQRLTGSGSTIGDPRIRAGKVLRLEGLGAEFGGLYRITSATHTVDSGGYRTSFEGRKEIWFGSIPLLEQGAVRVRWQDQPLFGINQGG